MTNEDIVTVQQAIWRGMKIIAAPAKYILIAASLLCLLLLVADFSWGWFLLLPAGMVLSILYSLFVTPRWRLWAYEHVNDIHQFQRSAELAGLLMKQSQNMVSTLLGMRQQDELKILQQRFLEEPVFIDDLSIPAETIIYSQSTFQIRKPLITLNDSGIQIEQERIMEWGEITDEHVAAVGLMYTTRGGYESTAGTKDYFRFNTATGISMCLFHRLPPPAGSWTCCFIHTEGATRQSKDTAT